MLILKIENYILDLSSSGNSINTQHVYRESTKCHEQDERPTKYKFTSRG